MCFQLCEYHNLPALTMFPIVTVFNCAQEEPVAALQGEDEAQCLHLLAISWWDSCRGPAPQSPRRHRDWRQWSEAEQPRQQRAEQAFAVRSSTSEATWVLEVLRAEYRPGGCSGRRQMKLSLKMSRCTAPACDPNLLQ